MVKLNEYTELSQNLLGRLVGMDKATMQGVVRRLKDRRLVEFASRSRRRAAHPAQPDDRRPAPGQQAADQRPAVSRETLKPLNVQEQRQLLELLSKII